VFVPGKPFQHSLMFVCKDRSLPYDGAPFSLTRKNKPDWKGVPGANTLAYDKHSQNPIAKCFINIKLRHLRHFPQKYYNLNSINLYTLYWNSAFFNNPWLKRAPLKRCRNFYTLFETPSSLNLSFYYNN
jgi:hypothetical protein